MAGEGNVGRAFQNVAAGIVAGMDEQVGTGDALGKGAGCRNAFAAGAAIGMRGGIEIGAAEFAPVAPVA